MRIVFVGTVEFSLQALLKLVDLRAHIAGVVTMQASPFNADFADLTTVCKAHNVSYFLTDDVNGSEVIRWIRERQPDVIFSFGWSRLLKQEVLDLAPMGVVGFHPAALPMNRGRHPIIWALALGLEQTASTFFFMDGGADSGDILSQREINIAYEDDAGTLYHKVTETALEQIEDFMPKLQSRTYNRLPQDHSRANYWRKRIKRDGKVDFRMSSRSIYNLIRALSRPYIGAHVVYDVQEVKAWRGEEACMELQNVEPGKILEVSSGRILVKCGENALWLTEHGFDELPRVGEYFS